MEVLALNLFIQTPLTLHCGPDQYPRSKGHPATSKIELIHGILAKLLGCTASEKAKLELKSSRLC